MTRSLLFAAFLTFTFVLRLLFGLYAPSVTADEDYTQTYVIGLKCFTTHTWPYYGPDVVAPETDFHTQMPGALEGLLGALPLCWVPSPESPFFFVNILSFLGLCLFAWYVGKRLPKLSPWFIFTWVLLAPWTTHYSTQIINPSYAFLGACLFFVGFLEATPLFSLGLWSPRWANAVMGFGLAWVMQLHMSWLALVPFLIFSLYTQAKEKNLTAILYAFLGSLPLLTLLFPTFFAYGFTTARDIHGFTTSFNLGNAKDLFGTLARFWAIASFEMPRFIGEHTHERVQYLVSSPLIVIPGFLLWSAGYAQVLGFTVYGALKTDWKPVQMLGWASFAVLYVCFLFSPDMGASFRILLFFPVIFLYSFYVYQDLAVKPWGRALGWVFLVSVVVFQVGYTVRNIQTGPSVYIKDREKIVRALEKKDYRLLAERREGSLY